jgi:hypothetical protein
MDLLKVDKGQTAPPLNNRAYEIHGQRGCQGFLP